MQYIRQFTTQYPKKCRAAGSTIRCVCSDRCVFLSGDRQRRNRRLGINRGLDAVVFSRRSDTVIGNFDGGSLVKKLNLVEDGGEKLEASVGIHNISIWHNF